MWVVLLACCSAVSAVEPARQNLGTGTVYGRNSVAKDLYNPHKDFGRSTCKNLFLGDVPTIDFKSVV